MEAETKLNYKVIGGDETKVKIIRDNGGRYTLVKKSEDFLLVQKACNTIPLLKEKNITPQKFINCSVQLESLDTNLLKQQNKRKRKRKRRINLPKLFQCVFCGRRFVNLFFLNNHQKSHHKLQNGANNMLNAPEFQNFAIKENKFESENGAPEKIMPIRLSLVQSKNNNGLLRESVVLKENRYIIDKEALRLRNNNNPHVEEWSKSAEKYHKKRKKHRRERDKPESEENTTNQNTNKVLCEGLAYFDDRVAQFKGELLLSSLREQPKLQENPYNIEKDLFQSKNHDEAMTKMYQQNLEKALNLLYTPQSDTNQVIKKNCGKPLKRKNCTENAQRKKKRLNKRRKQTESSESEFETTDDDLQKQQPRRSGRQKVNPCYSDAVFFDSDSTDIDEYLPYQQFESKTTSKRRTSKGKFKRSEIEIPKKIAVPQNKPKQTEVEDGEINSDEDFSCLVLQLSDSDETASKIQQEEIKTKSTPITEVLAQPLKNDRNDNK